MNLLCYLDACNSIINTILSPLSPTDTLNLLGLSQNTYTVMESEGQVEVCVVSIIPVATDTTATVVTVDQSANGMHDCFIPLLAFQKLL